MYVLEYLSHFNDDSKIGLELVSLSKVLPISQANENQQAKWLFDGTQKSPLLNALVVGAENDFIVDQQGVEETATFLGGMFRL